MFSTAVRQPAVKSMVRFHGAPIMRKVDACSTSCSNCCLQRVCLPRGLSAAGLSEFDDMRIAKRRVARGAALYRTRDAFQAVYAVRSGAFKTTGVSSNGVEKITGVHLPGEVMGLDAINNDEHNYDAIALEDSDVCVIPFAELTDLARELPELQQELFRLLSRDISRDHGLMLLLGSMTAEQRLAAFLLSLSRRYKRLGYAADRFVLRMTREDIGNYLGLTLETVSRIMSRFQREGLVATQQREVSLHDSEGLREIVGQW
jgi:CRP/FNR family transcriptional regulator